MFLNFLDLRITKIQIMCLNLNEPSMKRAPRAWYEHLSNFLIKQKFNRGKVDITLFIRHKAKYIFLVHIYVDDIYL